jgi:hypothetical protein
MPSSGREKENVARAREKRKHLENKRGRQGHNRHLLILSLLMNSKEINIIIVMSARGKQPQFPSGT